jgi:glycosyltransferase involved in cell wall biosynthesis
VDISIVVCTYNRASRLGLALKSLAALDAPTVEREVLVVDNRSTDGTRALVEGLIEKGHSVVRYLYEPRPGKSYALNTGIEHAQGTIIAFTDDDCVVDCQWLTAIRDEYALDSDLAVVGGRVELYDPRDLPVTIRTSRERSVISAIGFEPCDVPIIGCNVAYTRRALKEIGTLDPNLGIGGRSQVVAEDMDLLYRACKKGLKVVYSPTPVVYHNHGRQSAADMRIINRNYARGRGAFYCKHLLNGDRLVAKMVYTECRDLIRGFIGALWHGKKVSGGRTLYDLVVGGMLGLRMYLGRREPVD